MVVKAKSGNLNMSASSPAAGKKRKSVSGQWDVAGKDEGAANGKTQKTPVKKNADSAKPTPKNQNGQTKRESVGSGGPTPKKQKTVANNGTPGPKNQKANESINKTPPSQKKIKKEKKVKEETASNEQKLNESTATSPPTPKKKKNKKAAKKAGLSEGGPAAKKVKSDTSSDQSPKQIKKEPTHNDSTAHTPVKPESRGPQPKVNAFPGWNAAELLQLVGRIEDFSATLLNVKTTEVNDQINWKKVSFDKHSPEECKATWLKLVDKSRRTRELIDEARKMLVEKIPKHCFVVKKDEEVEVDTKQLKKGSGKMNKKTAKAEEEESEDEEVEEEEEEEEEEEGTNLLSREVEGSDEEIDGEDEDDDEEEEEEEEVAGEGGEEDDDDEEEEDDDDEEEDDEEEMDEDE